MNAVQESRGHTSSDRQFGVIQLTMHRGFHVNFLFTFHVQALLAFDFPVRSEFCQWLVNTHERGDFISNILATDECFLTRGGILNISNTHCWADKNPCT